MYRLLFCLLTLIFANLRSLAQQPDVSANGCEIAGRIYQEKNTRPPTYLGLPVFFDNGVFVNLPKMGINYPCYRAVSGGASCRVCSSKNIFGGCSSYYPTVGKIYTFSYSKLNCPLENYLWVFGLLISLVTVCRLRRSIY